MRHAETTVERSTPWRSATSRCMACPVKIDTDISYFSLADSRRRFFLDTDTAGRPEGARSGPVGYGPNLQALAVYLMVAHFLPAHRVVALLESLTGTGPSVGFVHSMLARTAGLLGAVHDRILDRPIPGGSSDPARLL